MSKITISIPTPLRSYTNNQKRIELDAENVENALAHLVDNYPQLKDHLFEGDQIRNFVNIYLNDEDIRYLTNNDQTVLNEGDEIAIIPSIAGGLR